MRRLFVVALPILVLFLQACGDDSDDDPTATPAGSPIEVAEGVFARIEPAPPAPTGPVLISDYYVFETDEDTGLVIGLRLTSPQTDTVGIGLFTYGDGRWTGAVAAISLQGDGTILEGVFPAPPANVAAFDFGDEDPPESFGG